MRAIYAKVISRDARSPIKRKTKKGKKMWVTISDLKCIFKLFFT